MDCDDILNFVPLDHLTATSGQPSAEQFRTIAAQGYAAVVNLAMPDSRNALADEGGIVSALGMVYVHIPVPFEDPRPEHLRLFVGVLRALAGQKIWIHCALNYRVSAFMYQYRRRVLGLDEAAARSPMFQRWEPDPVWRAFMQMDPGEMG
jgi:protein tyrosine phosphatase (PTP) superfamily phosphohydrolase (DUF442 family)